MSSSYQAYNLSYDQPSSHAQQYWNSININGQYPPPKPSQTSFDYSGPHLTANVPLGNRAGLNRTPSPTPSEVKELQTGAIDFKAMSNWRFWIRREWLWYYVALFFIIVLTTLITIFHDQIVTWLTPVTKELTKLKFGWMVPIGILFVLSFPPLFGQEIVHILCGLVWGLWIGFAIVAAGTFIGEVGNFYAFKYCCRARGEKMEKNKMYYACLARVVREGGFKVALIARLSAIPGHFTTAIFSTCGMNIFVFALAAFLSLPKQFITVYLGVILKEAAGQETTKQKLISDGVVAITILVTVAACWYILRKMNEAKPAVIYARRKARQAKMGGGGIYATPNDSSSDIFNPNTSETNIPLTAKKQTQFGHGVGQGQPYPFSSEYQSQSSSSAGNGNIVYAPKPQHRYSPDNRYGNSSDEDLVGGGALPQGAAPASSYDYTPTRQASDDSFNPNSLAVTSSPRLPPGVSNPNFSSPPSQPQSPHQNASLPYSSHPVATSTSTNPYTHSYQTQPEVVQTPTQAPSVSYNNTSGYQSPAMTGMVGPSSQYAAPQAYIPQHAYEPTDATYHTAMGSSSSDDAVSMPLQASSPPGYR